MTLTQTAVFTKRAIVIFFTILFLVIVSRVGYTLWLNNQLANRPKPVELPEQKFGSLPELPLPPAQVSSSNYNYTVNTVTGELPEFPKLLKVYFIPQRGLSLLAADRAKILAEKLATKTPYVIRLKVPENTKIIVSDSLVGEVEFDSNLIDDQVLVKSDGFPTYHLAVVVDDYLMKISHVIRGTEWLPSTPKHILLYRAFGWEEAVPTYTHIPVILNADGRGKLSKRDGHASVDYYKNEGFLPEAILNYLSNIVWNHPEGKEIYPLEELKLAVDINSPKVIAITSQAPRFDLNKLRWMNGEYIRMLSDEELTRRLVEFLPDHPEPAQIAPLAPLVKERIKTLAEFVPLTDFIFTEPEYEVSVFEGLKITDTQKVLAEIAATLAGLGPNYGAEDFEATFRALAEKLEIKVSPFFQLFRVAVAGQLITPPLFETIAIIGRDKVLQRVKNVAEKYPNF